MVVFVCEACAVKRMVYPRAHAGTAGVSILNGNPVCTFITAIVMRVLPATHCGTESHRERISRRAIRKAPEQCLIDRCIGRHK
jgi:hypothetical protein